MPEKTREPRMASSSIIFVRHPQNGRAYVGIFQRTTKKENRWSGTFTFGPQGAANPGESLDAALRREFFEELPRLGASHVLSIEEMGRVLHHVTAPHFKVGGKPLPKEHIGDAFNNAMYAVKLRPNAVRDLGGFFEEDVATAIAKAKGQPFASETKELRKPVFVPYARLKDYAEAHPGEFQPHSFHALLGLSGPFIGKSRKMRVGKAKSARPRIGKK